MAAQTEVIDEVESTASAETPSDPSPPSSDTSASASADDISRTATETAEPSADRCIVIVDGAAYGIDPIVAGHVTNRMRSVSASLGYRVLDRNDVIAGSQQTGMPYPPGPADLWRLTSYLDCHRFAFARIGATGRLYQYRILVGSLDNTGPFETLHTSPASNLLESVDQALRATLVPSTVWDADGARLIRREMRIQDEVRNAPAPAPEPFLGRRFQISLGSESAFGVSDDGFYNHLLAIRADYRINARSLIGVGLAYTNLKGRDGRVSNLLPTLQFEHRVRFQPHHTATMPLRFGVGYLPFNGPFLRFSLGTNFEISDTTEVGLDLLAPTLWILPDVTAVSLNVGAEVVFRL